MGLFSLFGKSSNVYFPGDMTDYKHREIYELYQRIFQKLGIGFCILEDCVSCGIEAMDGGYENEARKLARMNFKLFKEEGVEGIITTSPECYKMFLKHYPDIIFDWNISVLNTWGLILRELQRKPRLIKNPAMEEVCFHDNCYLGRGCGIYEEPRRILEVLGYDVIELDDSYENSLCCGSCGGLIRTNPDLANKIAKERLLQVKRLGMKKLIVSSVDNYDLLKINDGDLGVEVLELSEVIAEALEIERVRFEKDEEVEGEGDVLDGERDIFEEVETNKKLNEELEDEDLYDDIMEDEDDRL